MSENTETQPQTRFSPKTTRPNFEAQRKAANAYAERCRALLDAGLKPVTITKEGDPTHWRDWRNYYRRNGLLASLDLMEQNRAKSVPTRSPFEFEPVIDRRIVD